MKHGKITSAFEAPCGRKNKRPADSDGHHSISCFDAFASCEIWAGDRCATSAYGERDNRGLGDQHTPATASERKNGNNSQ